MSSNLAAAMPSRQDCFHHLAMYIRQPEVAALELIGKPGVVDAKQVHDRRIQVEDLDRVANNVVREVVGFAVSDSRLDAAAGQPEGEAAWVVVSTVIVRCELTL